MTEASGEIRNASRFSGLIVATAATALFGAVCLTVVQQAIAVPELSRGILRDETTVQIEVLPPVETQLLEHLAEVSEVKVDAMPEPVKKPDAKPETKPENKPKPVKPVPKKSAVKSVRKPAPQKTPAEKIQKAETGASDSAPTGSGLADTVPVRETSGGQSLSTRQTALAEIIAVIQAHKRYPRRARQTGVEGEVVLAVTVNNAGIITAVTLKKPHPSMLLNRAALKAAEPLIGRKLAISDALNVEVPVRFSLSSL